MNPPKFETTTRNDRGHVAVSTAAETRLPHVDTMECNACSGDGRGFCDQPCESCAGWGHFLALPEADIEAWERAGRMGELHDAAGKRFGPRAYDQPSPWSEAEVEAAARAALGMDAALDWASRAVAGAVSVSRAQAEDTRVAVWSRPDQLGNGDVDGSGVAL